MQRIIISLLLITSLGACSQQETNENEEASEEHEGMIVQKKEDGKLPQVLLVPEITEEEFKQKSDHSIKKLAQDKDGAYYTIENEENFDQLELGDTVNIYWNGNQSSSDPPQRGATKIEIIETLQD